jgi:hypothetical protein
LRQESVPLGMAGGGLRQVRLMLARVAFSQCLPQWQRLFIRCDRFARTAQCLQDRRQVSQQPGKLQGVGRVVAALKDKSLFDRGQRVLSPPYVMQQQHRGGSGDTGGFEGLVVRAGAVEPQGKDQQRPGRLVGPVTGCAVQVGGFAGGGQGLVVDLRQAGGQIQQSAAEVVGTGDGRDNSSSALASFV